MQHAKRKLRPIVKFHGGKSYLARWIIGFLPEHDLYVEGYCGGLNVLLNKPRSPREVACDTNPYLINLYKVIQDPVLFEQLAAALEGIKYNESAFTLARTVLQAQRRWDGWEGPWLCLDEFNQVVVTPDLGRALLYLVYTRFSVDGLGEAFSWSERLRGKTSAGGPKPGDENAWETLKLLLPTLRERLVGVEILCHSAMDVLLRFAGPGTVFYLDPPYPHETRTSKRSYGEGEMSDLEHEDLLKVLVTLPARGIFISTYWNDLYESILGPAGWDFSKKDMPNHSARGKVKQRRQEVLWFRV